MFNDGEEIRLLCRSETKGSQDFLQWNATGDVELPDTAVYLSEDRSHILATLTLTVDHSFNDVSFTCSRRSSLLLPIVDNCTLGPFYINSPTTRTPTTSDPIITSGGVGGATVAAIIIIIIIIILLAVLLILWKSGKLITCKTSNDSSQNTLSNNENRLENRRNDNQLITGNQRTIRLATEEVTVCPNAEQRSSSNDQYTHLNLADAGNSTYTDLKHRPSAIPSTCNTSAEPHKYGNVNLQEARPAAEDQYYGLNTGEIGDTIYMGLLKNNEHKASQMSSPNLDEAKKMRVRK